MRYAVILLGVVNNIIIWDGEAKLSLPDNYQLVNVTDVVCKIGDIYVDGTFSEPPTQEN